MNDRVWVWGLPFSPVTRAECLDVLTALVRAGVPSYIITANTHYAMLSKEAPSFTRSTSGRPSSWPTGRRWSGPRGCEGRPCRSG